MGSNQSVKHLTPLLDRLQKPAQPRWVKIQAEKRAELERKGLSRWTAVKIMDGGS